MSAGSWQAALRRQAEESYERARSQPVPWWVRFAPPLPKGVFAEGRDAHVMARTLYGMRAPVVPTPTDREGVTFFPLYEREYLVADESDMPAVMRCVRLTGLHGRYQKAGETRGYRF